MPFTQEKIAGDFFPSMEKRMNDLLFYGKGFSAGKSLSANQIKWIAIAAMLIDHITWAFIPTYSAWGQILHVIGRITAPTMCFFLAEGYAHTRSVKKYALRLGLFALVSHIPFVLFETGKPLKLFPCSVIYTLFLSLLAIWAWDKIQDKMLRLLAIFALCILSMPGDWMFFDILWALIFWVNRGDFKKQAQYFSILSIGLVLSTIPTAVAKGQAFYADFFQAGVFLSLPILALYNGARGGGKYSKWTFYLFYPVHLLIIGCIKLWLKG
jgi:hypothetical protein